MTNKEIGEKLKEGYYSDTNYRIVFLVDNLGMRGSHAIKVDIVNEPYDYSFAKYYKVNSVDDCKEIFDIVLPECPADLKERLFEQALSETGVDLNKGLFLSIYKPDRLGD